MGLIASPAPLITPYSQRFANATFLNGIPGIDPTGATDSTAAFNALTAGYYVGAPGSIYRLDSQWTVKSGMYVWLRGAHIDSQYDAPTGAFSAIIGTVNGWGLYGGSMSKPDPAEYGGRLIGVVGNQIQYWDLTLTKFDAGGIAINGDDIYCNNIYLDSEDYLVGNFGIRDFGGRRRSYLNIEGYTGDDMIALATGPTTDKTIANAVISGIRGRSYGARLIAIDLIDQDNPGGMEADLLAVSVSNVVGTSLVNAITIRNLDSDEPHEINGVSLTDIDITLSNPGPPGQISTRPLSIIGGTGYVRNVTTSNVILRNTLNQDVSPSGLTSDINTSGVTCL